MRRDRYAAYRKTRLDSAATHAHAANNGRKEASFRRQWPVNTALLPLIHRLQGLFLAADGLELLLLHFDLVRISSISFSMPANGSALRLTVSMFFSVMAASTSLPSLAMSFSRAPGAGGFRS